MKEHLPNLNALRFLAATLVLIGHVDMGLYNLGYNKTLRPYFAFSVAPVAVVLFFTLSGFLITYLLLREKDSGNISIKKFYLKRILRIWPLYFLVLLLAFGLANKVPFFFWPVVLPAINFSDYWLPLLLISPNIAISASLKQLGYASQTWSIGVEEQFYLIWPFIMRSKNFVFFILVVIVLNYLLYNGLGQILDVLVSYKITSQKGVSFLRDFFTAAFSFKIDAMAIGALGAVLVAKKHSLVNLVFNRQTQILMYLTLIPLLLFGQIVNYQFYSIIFCAIIMNLSFNKETIINLNFAGFDYLGRISYGIYMLHMFTIVPSIKLVLEHLNLQASLISELIICFVSLVSTVIISAVSYRFFETPFLRLKNKFQTTTSPNP